MEGGLLKTWFAKLLEALRFERVSGHGLSGAEPSDRSVTPFEVISDGLKIRGSFFYPSSHPDKMYPGLIICHGIPGGGPRSPDDAGYEGLAEEFCTLGLTVAIFNFRGCGDSEGDFDIMGWTRDLEAVLDKVLNTPHVDPTRVLVLGFSAGGAAAVTVASESKDVYGLALAGTPAHFRAMADDLENVVEDFRARGIIRDPDFPSDVKRWAEGFAKIEPRNWIPHFKGSSLLIVHGDTDELIPVEQAKELHEAAPAGITKLVILSGGQHQLRKDKRCIEAVKSWILETLGWKEEDSPQVPDTR